MTCGQRTKRRDWMQSGNGWGSCTGGRRRCLPRLYEHALQFAWHDDAMSFLPRRNGDGHVRPRSLINLTSIMCHKVSAFQVIVHAAMHFCIRVTEPTPTQLQQFRATANRGRPKEGGWLHAVHITQCRGGRQFADYQSCCTRAMRDTALRRPLHPRHQNRRSR